jgi:hypothetical protein
MDPPNADFFFDFSNNANGLQPTLNSGALYTDMDPPNADFSFDFSNDSHGLQAIPDTSALYTDITTTLGRTLDETTAGRFALLSSETVGDFQMVSLNFSITLNS